MEKWKNIKLDDEKMWPKTGIVDLESAHTDDRGSIQSLVNFPMKGTVDCLNVSVSAGVCLYEAVRQRAE